MDQIDAIVEELRAISERLNDASMLLLSDAIERGETTRPAMEKQISQARRAVDKAIHHLVLD
jgi:predicted DNA-binding protein (UPF0251 family)